MLFSDYFKIDKKIIEVYGAIDISLVCDIPLFIDPLLIFNSTNKEYLVLHKKIIKYFHFLAEKSKLPLNKAEIKTWYTFKEVYNNWLGYALEGNKGSALELKFGEFLYKNIGFALQTHGISSGEHAEKVMLLYDGSGKDKISDMTVNLIKGYLCEYTQKFAEMYLNSNQCRKFQVDKADFNYNTESFVTKEYYLPYIINEKNKEEYVLLTPADILRKNDPTINKEDMIRNNRKVRESIDNDVLRTQVNNYIAKAVGEFETAKNKEKKKASENKIKLIEREAFTEILNEQPILYDYYVRMKEKEADISKEESKEEVKEQLEKFIKNAENLVKLFKENNYKIDERKTAYEESKDRIAYFKHIIEDCDGWKNMYNSSGERITNENDLQRMFKFVWYNTDFKNTAETNNGCGPADFVISKGSKNQNIIEFKLASNSRLPHVFEQVKTYMKANETDKSIIVIFYFSQQELSKVHKMIDEAGAQERLGEDIILIDCRNDNKISASKR